MSSLTCQQLASQIEELQPKADVRDVARLCLLLCNAVDDPAALAERQKLTSAWADMGLQLQAATDQHAAMTQELEMLAQSDPRQFTPDQIWILLRAIKVQSQILQLYVGQSAIDV